MAGDTLYVNADFHTATVTAVDAAVGRLGRDHELRNDLADVVDVLPAHAVAVFFLNGTNNHDLVARRNEAQILHDLATVGSGSHAAFLVRAATAVDHFVCFVTGVGVFFPVVDVADTDGVDVGVNGDDLVAGAHPADNVAKAVDFNLVVAQLFHFSSNSLNNFFFVARLGRNRNHVAEELGHVCFVAFRGFFDGIKINVHG